MADQMTEKYRKILQMLFEQYLEADGFQKCRSYGEFLRKSNGFEQSIYVGYAKNLGRHFYGLRLQITHPDFDKLYSEITESRQKKVPIWSYCPDYSSNGSNALFCSFGPSRAYLFHEKDDEQRIVEHLYRIISGKLYPLAREYSSFDRILQAYEQQTCKWQEAKKELSGKIRSNERYYGRMALYLLAGRTWMAERLFLNFSIPSKATWSVETEKERLAAAFQHFPDRKDYCVFCTGHLDDRYHTIFLNPSDSVLEQELSLMNGGFHQSTAFLKYRDDGSYLQIGGTPSGYTAEIRLYNSKEDGIFQHQKACLKDFSGEDTVETLCIDDHEVQVKKSQILTTEDAIACMTAFRHQKTFPDLFAWEDITGWF